MNEFHLFAGIGGGILGGMLNGNIPVGAVEIEEYPRKVLIQRQIDGCLPVFPIWDDVRTFRADNEECRWFIEHLRSIRDDLRICGGFPCQDISAAGKGAGLDGERSGLWREFKRIISEIRPRNVFIENSPILTVRGGVRVIADLAEMGYNARWGIISAEDCGAWHQRERFWCTAEIHNSDSLGRVGNSCPQNGENKIPDSVHARDWRRFRGQSEVQRPCGAGDTDGRGTEILSCREWWASEPGLGRVADGVANRVDRLKGIGNAQVPVVAAVAERVLTL